MSGAAKMRAHGTPAQPTAGSHKLSIRIDLGPTVRLGPGKIALLEAIDAAGSISGAGRLLKMSYKKAWDLTEDLNRGFTEPLLATIAGGAHGGGTQLTPNGRALVTHYRAIERLAQDAAQTHLKALARMAPNQDGKVAAPVDPASCEAVPRMTGLPPDPAT